jgi:hypothetical protein
MLQSGFQSDNENPQHPPNKQKGHDSRDNMANPLPRCSRLAEMKHAAIVALLMDHAGSGDAGKILGASEM